MAARRLAGPVANAREVGSGVALERAIAPPSQAGVGFGLGSGSPVWFLRKLGRRGIKLRRTSSFFNKCSQNAYSYMTRLKADPLPKNSLRNATSFASAKLVKVNCRCRSGSALDGLHIANGAEPWRVPARRLADPCVARTSGALSRALFHSPVPGPGHDARHSGHVPRRPRFS